MRGYWIGAAAAAALCAALSGCGAVDDLTNADDPVPTDSAEPSASTPTAEGGSTLSAEPSPSAERSEESSAPPKPSGTASTPAQTEPAPADVDLGTAPTSYREAAAYVAEAADEGGTQQMQVFGTSEDIYCLMASDYIQPSCELPQGAGVDDQKVCRNAMGDRVGRIEVTQQRARAVCNTDTIRESRPVTVEPVGVVTNAKSGLKCAVADIGVTCVQPDRKVGYFLSLDSYATFG